MEYYALRSSGMNPWVGLAEKIFTDLGQGLVDRVGAAGEQIFSNIGTARKLERDLLSNCKGSEETLAQATNRYQHTYEDHADTVREYAHYNDQAKWDAIMHRFADNLPPNEAKEINQAGDVLGLRDLSRRPQELDQVLQQAKTLGSRASLLTSSQSVRHYFGPLFFILVAALLSVVLVTVTMQFYTVNRDFMKALDQLRNLLATLSAVVTVIGGVLVLFARGSSSRAIEQLERREMILRIPEGIGKPAAYPGAVRDLQRIFRTGRGVPVGRMAICSGPLFVFDADGVDNSLKKRINRLRLHPHPRLHGSSGG